LLYTLDMLIFNFIQLLTANFYRPVLAKEGE
jgi:hypothetical protein